MAFMSGKALFTYNPELFKDDENAADDYEDVEEEESKKEETLEEAGIDKEQFKNEKVEEDEPDFD
jgi:hypothetical protein